MYEPYIIAARAAIPHFDERFKSVEGGRGRERGEQHLRVLPPVCAKQRESRVG